MDSKKKLDLNALRKLGYAVIDIATNSYEADKDIYKFIMVPVDHNIYSSQLKELLHITLPEQEAQMVMEEIYKHKWIESEKAHHDIGLTQAAKDWYDNHFEDWKKYKEKTK